MSKHPHLTLLRSGRAALLLLAATLVPHARAEGPPCSGLPTHSKLREGLQAAVKGGKNVNSGLGNQEWAAVVDRDGVVCAVVFSGPDRGAQWPGSRLIAAQKANTANALSGPNFALSTANLYFQAQPGQPLFGLHTSAPPNPVAAYAGPPEKFGQPDDPLVGKPIGGVIVFGGGLPLYDAKGTLVGGLGVSGDTACADHVVAWKVRHALKLDAIPAGACDGSTDNMVLDLVNGQSASGYGHPACKSGIGAEDIIRKLPAQFPVGPKRR